MEASIKSLRSALLMEIFKNLDAKSLKNAALVSKR